MSEKLNLFQKIQAVSNEIMNIEKDMTVGSGSYSYKAVSDNMVTLAVKRAEAKFGLVSIPIKQELVSSEVLKQIKSGKESVLFIDNIKMTVRIIDIDTPADFVDIESFGKGVDNGDKGFGKASTYARKYALLNAYKIATGEDPDADKSKEVETLTYDEKKISVLNIIQKDELLKNNVLSHFGIDDEEGITEDMFKTIYTQFKIKNLV